MKNVEWLNFAILRSLWFHHHSAAPRRFSSCSCEVAHHSAPLLPCQGNSSKEHSKVICTSLQAQPGWMPHKFTTHSLCYALLFPEGWEKSVALARWARSLSTYQEKELSLKEKKNPFGCAARSLALSVMCNLEWGLKSSICCITAGESPLLC